MFSLRSSGISIAPERSFYARKRIFLREGKVLRSEDNFTVNYEIRLFRSRKSMSGRTDGEVVERSPSRRQIKAGIALNQ
jgi:hypothetical protein